MCNVTQCVTRGIAWRECHIGTKSKLTERRVTRSERNTLRNSKETLVTRLNARTFVASPLHPWRYRASNWQTSPAEPVPRMKFAENTIPCWLSIPPLPPAPPIVFDNELLSIRLRAFSNPDIAVQSQPFFFFNSIDFFQQTSRLFRLKVNWYLTKKKKRKKKEKKNREAKTKLHIRVYTENISRMQPIFGTLIFRQRIGQYRWSFDETNRSAQNRRL